MNELSTNLGTVFLARLAVGNLSEVLIPILKVSGHAPEHHMSSTTLFMFLFLFCFSAHFVLSPVFFVEVVWVRDRRDRPCGVFSRKNTRIELREATLPPPSPPRELKKQTKGVPWKFWKFGIARLT